MTQTLETLKNEFPDLGKILIRVDEIESGLKEQLSDKDREIRQLNRRIEELESDISDKEELIEELEESEKDTSDIPERLLQRDLDPRGKVELFTEAIDKFNWFELKERLQK